MQLVLSLFPGIGLLDMAFEQEGFCVVRGPDVLWGGDIKNFHPPQGKFNGIIGGPPCQSFSGLSALVRFNGHEPKFGNLIPEFERCVLEALPGWFLMENVPAAPVPSLRHYNTHSFLLDNVWLGEEQRRKRRFTFGTWTWPEVDLRRWINLAALELPKQHATIHAGHDQPPKSQWSKTEDGASVRMRRYKLKDACCLQGLPEDFLKDCPLTSEGKLKAVANGVPIPMGVSIAKAIRHYIKEP